MFTMPGPLDFVAIARTTREFWDREQVFTRLVSRNRGGPRFPSSTARSPPITRWASITRGGAPRRTWSSATRRWAATISGSRTGSTARALGGGRGREDARVRLEARDRVVRPRALLPRLSRARAPLRRHPDRAIQEAGAVDGLAELVLHDVGSQHRAQLALSPAVPRARLVLRGTPRDAVVRAMRDLDLATRDAGRLR